MSALEVVEQLEPGDVDQVLRLVDAAAREDGVVPLSEHVLLHLRLGGERPARHFLLRDGDGGDSGEDVLVGYAHLDPTDLVAGPSAELVIHPERRRGGLGRALVRAIEAEVAAPGGRLRLWAHGRHSAARELALSLGYTEIRELWQMRRSLLAELPPLEVPPGAELRTYRDADAEALLGLNAAAFAAHPEQGSWTVTDLRARMAEPWFDPAGLYLAEDQRGGLLAFGWTKVHGSQPEPGGDPGHGHHPIGEIYVVGVRPDAWGRGLGRLVTLAGLHHLRALGVEQAMLYVDADNTRALRTYVRLGFSRWDVDVQFRQSEQSE